MGVAQEVMMSKWEQRDRRQNNKPRRHYGAPEVKSWKAYRQTQYKGV